MGLPTLSFIAPHGADNAPACRVSILGGLPTPSSPTRPFSADGGSPHNWRLIVRAQPGSRSPPQSPLIARPREKNSRAYIEIHTMRMASSSIYADSTAMLIATQTQPSGAASSFTCTALTSRCRTHPCSYSRIHRCPCLLNPHFHWARTLLCNLPTM